MLAVDNTQVAVVVRPTYTARPATTNPARLGTVVRPSSRVAPVTWAQQIIRSMSLHQPSNSLYDRPLVVSESRLMGEFAGAGIASGDDCVIITQD